MSFSFDPISENVIYPKAKNLSVYSFRKSLIDLFTKNKKNLLAFLLLLFICLFALFGPYFQPFTYYDTNLALKNLPPSFEHWFGTDELGRDLFIRTAYGARISLTIGICAALIDVTVGVFLGMVAGLYGGKIDEILMRICDIFSSLPYLLTVILLMVVLGQGIFTILLSLTLTGWINMARIIRAHVFQLKNKEYILAAKALGGSKTHILFSHLLFAALGPILATMTVTIPLAIYTESFLSFLGLGIQAPIASWGSMVNDSISALRYYPWRLFFPAFLIFLTMLSFNLLGQGANDNIDPWIQR